MNDRQMIDQVRTLLAPMEPPPYLRGQVSTVIAASAETTRPAWGRSWRLTTVGAVATTGVLALLVGQVVSIDGKPPAASAQAAEILHQAADVARADQTPVPRPDQFVLTETKAFFPVVGQNGPGTSLSRSWMSVDGTHDGLIWTSDPAAGGRQSTVIPGCRDGQAAEWASDGSLLNSTRPCTPASAYLSDLPTDAAGMLTHLQRMSEDTAPSSEETFANVGVLIRRGYLPAQSRAALYEAATKIPGVVASPAVTDAAGRSGAGVSLAGKTDRYDLIFDPQTYEFLGWQVVPVAADGGQQSRREVVLDVAIVDRPGQTS